MAKKTPGKFHREGITIVELMDMFPTEEAEPVNDLETPTVSI